MEKINNSNRSKTNKRPLRSGIKLKNDTIRQAILREEKMMDRISSKLSDIKLQSKKTKPKRKLLPKSERRTGQMLGKNCYLTALIEPEVNFGCRVPVATFEKTVCLHRHLTNVVVIGSNVATSTGQCAIVFQPYFLADNTSIGTNTPLAVNNALAFSANIGALIPGVSLGANAYSLPVGNVDSYRLVSASMHVVVLEPLLTGVGKISGAVSTLCADQWTVGPLAANLGVAALSTQSLLENSPFYDETFIQQGGSALRFVYYPADDQDTIGTYEINNITGKQDDKETVFICLVNLGPTLSGVQVNVNLEIYLNYEVIPSIGSVVVGMEGFSTEPTALKEHAYKTLKNNQGLIVHPFTNGTYIKDFKNIKTGSMTGYNAIMY